MSTHYSQTLQLCENKREDVCLIPGLPNEIWRLIVIAVYDTLPEDYREHAVSTLRSVSRGWRQGVEGMSVLWTLVTFGRALSYPVAGLRLRLTHTLVTLPDYAATAAERPRLVVANDRREETENLDGPGLPIRPSGPGGDPECDIRSTWDDFTTRQKCALRRFNQSLSRSSAREMSVRIKLHKCDGIPLWYLTRQLFPHAARISELDVDIHPHRWAVDPGEIGMFFAARSDRLRNAADQVVPEDEELFHCTERMFDFTCLTSLSLYNVCFRTKCEHHLLLQRCLALRTLTVDRNEDWPPLPSTQEKKSRPTALILPQLEHLNMELSFLMHLLEDGIETPVLTQLCLSNPLNIDTDNFQGKPPTYAWMAAVEKLGLRGVFSDDVIGQYLVHTPVLKMLALQSCGTPTLCTDILTRRATYSGIGRSVIAPRLENIKLCHSLVDDQSVLHTLNHRPVKQDEWPKPLMFDISNCRKTTPLLGMEIFHRRRGVWMP
ncbi:hypothetical protein DACRYDRAFT_119741 [Dacryopinax primogenitus]|uniref:F-box domain-containing protein n=1 Tax=Dacryopinax primogenitus (strain DJM 731) TaxID=1858805 RepID=M5FQE2_DACPD|nr:uncharacterized protein DACRYDRAFT_119741 [Dacryopinax primogenitus]EJT96924.1 hypothetical protein DACRYDRAFT_119741 [Dacryopinax primogenitus]